MPETSRRRSRVMAILDFLRQLLGKKSAPPPVDPDVYVMAPVRRGPTGRSGAAIAEPEDDSYREFPPRR